MAIRDSFKRLLSRHKPSVELVRFYDSENDRIIQIPASELAPGVIEARVVGIDGLVWIDSSNLQLGDIKHPPFADDVREYIRKTENTFKEHRDLSFDEWEEGFRRDVDPIQEIALWVHAADVYSAFADSEVAADRREDIYRCILACLTSSPDHVWHVLDLTALSRDEAAQVVNRYYGKKTKQ
jgi:hypothetical protein